MKTVVKAMAAIIIIFAVAALVTSPIWWPPYIKVSIEQTTETWRLNPREYRILTAVTVSKLGRFYVEKTWSDYTTEGNLELVKEIHLKDARLVKAELIAYFANGGKLPGKEEYKE